MKPVAQKVPFPERLEKIKEEKQYAKFLETMMEVQITIPILDAVLHIPLYAIFFKDLITTKRSLSNFAVRNSETYLYDTATC